MQPDEIVALAKRRRNILSRLELLSEAPAATAFELRTGTTVGRAGSKPPPGTRMSKPLARLAGTSPDDSLYRFYLEKFSEARGDLARTERLCSLAEADWWAHRVQGGKARRDPKEDKNARNRRIIEQYRGVPAVEVADHERMRTKEVKGVRKEFGRDPDDGLALIGITKIGELLGVSSQRADQLTRREDFPAPVESRSTARKWRPRDVERWAKRHRPEGSQREEPEYV